jgi:DNA-directed RNA polymerase subunit alpha
MDKINFIKPEKIVMIKSSNTFGLFEIKPLEPGFGITLGNAIRRVLLSSLEGYAITSLKIDGVHHEFSTIQGVLEDITEIVLNLKQVKIKNEVSGFDKEVVTADLTNYDKVTALDLGKFSSYFKALNTDLVICNKEKTIPLNISYTIEKGRGYVSAEDNVDNITNLSSSLGTIYIDAIYTPILNVKYNIKNCRVDNKTDFENLLLEINTDGSIHPKDALNKAAHILIEHFILFSDKNVNIDVKKNINKNKYDDNLLRMRKILKTRLSDVSGLSRRTLNCLNLANIQTWKDLVTYDQNSILKMRNFGKKSLNELQIQMKNFGIYFGMDISDFELNNK